MILSLTINNLLSIYTTGSLALTLVCYYMRLVNGTCIRPGYHLHNNVPPWRRPSLFVGVGIQASSCNNNISQSKEQCTVEGKWAL